MELRQGYKLTDLGILPEDWTTQSGEQLTTLIGKGGSPRWQGFKYSNQGMLFVTSENVRDGFLDIREPKYLPIAFHEKLKRTKLQTNDILINLVGASIGRSCQIRQDLGEANINQAVAVFRVKENICSEYIAYCLQAPKTVARIFEMQVDAARPNISLGDLRRFLLPTPSLQEQCAIASALTDVDALIAGLEQLIVKHRDLKQATMQQLLTGQTRLPGFSGAWSLGTLGDVVASLEAGVSVNSTDDMPFPGMSCVLKTSALEGGEFLPQECKVIESGDIRRARTNPRRDTILISRMNTPLLVGEVAYIDQDYDWLFLPDRVWMTRFKTNSNLCVRWLAYVLSSRTYREALREIATGTSGSMKNISKSALLALPIEFPEPNEQTAISTVLSDMDAGLGALEARLAKTRALKTGMMQELLTGRTRLV